MSIFQRADGEFDWDEHTQGLILGCFYYGLTCMQLGAGWLSDRVGGKRVFGYGMLCFSVLTTITPWVARAGVPHLVTLRVVQGVAGVSDLRWQWSGMPQQAGWGVGGGGQRSKLPPSLPPHPQRHMQKHSTFLGSLNRHAIIYKLQKTTSGKNNT